MAYSNSPGQRGTKRAVLRGALGKSLRRGSVPRSPAPSKKSHGKNEIGQDAVSSVIEGEILPAMLNARQAGITDQSYAPQTIPSDRVREFARLPLHLETAGLTEEVRSFMDEGVSIETIYDELISPAARWLGEMWEQDSCDFMDVTMGLWRLQEVMQDISFHASKPPEKHSTDAKKAIFLPMPGEQHFMGAQILEDVFVRAGWDAIVRSEPSRREILGLLSKESFDVVGLTLSRDCPSASIRNIISAMRAASRNPFISVLVGGRMINQNPAVVAEVGADGTGADARAALVMAERLVKSAKVRAQTLR